MIVLIVNKVLLVLFVMSTLNIVRHVYYFLQAYIRATDEAPVRYVLSPAQLWIFAASVGYFITGIVQGIGI